MTDQSTPAVPHRSAMPPAPTGGALVGGPLGEWPARVSAWFVDQAPFIALLVVSGILSLPGILLTDLFAVLCLLAAVAWWLYIGHLSGTGQTPGKKVHGLRLISETTGLPIGSTTGIIRSVAHVLDGLLCGIGYLLPLIDPKKQTIADKVCRTLVVNDAPKALFSTQLYRPVR